MKAAQTRSAAIAVDDDGHTVAMARNRRALRRKVGRRLVWVDYGDLNHCPGCGECALID